MPSAYKGNLGLVFCSRFLVIRVIARVNSAGLRIDQALWYTSVQVRGDHLGLDPWSLNRAGLEKVMGSCIDLQAGKGLCKFSRMTL